MEIKLQGWGDNSASKLLVFKHTDLSSHLQNPHKKPGMVAYACNSTDQRKRQKALWGFLAVSQVEWVSSRLREKPCGEWVRKILNVAHLWLPHLCIMWK